MGFTFGIAGWGVEALGGGRILIRGPVGIVDDWITMCYVGHCVMIENSREKNNLTLAMVRASVFKVGFALEARSRMLRSCGTKDLTDVVLFH